MKKVLVVCFVVLFFASNAFAFSAGDFGKIAGGVIASMVVHEAGHQIAGEATGGIHWEQHGAGWVYVYDGKNLELVSASGFLLQGIGSEALMATQKRDNKFLLGYVGFNILNNLGYVAKTEMNIGSQTYGDLNNFKNKKQRRLVEAVVFAHAAWLSYRLWSDKDFKNFIGLEINNETPMLKASRKF